MQINYKKYCVTGTVMIFSVLYLIPLSFAHDNTTSSQAVNECDSYEQDVSDELEQLTHTSNPVVVKQTDADHALLSPGIVYEIEMLEQVSTPFIISPERVTVDAGSYGAVLPLSISKPGTYRVSVNNETWVDIVDETSAFVDSSAFAGRIHCTALRKLVEFNLHAEDAYHLQLSGVTDRSIRLLITHIAAETPE